jgi:precorrin-6B methylase 2
MLIDTIKALLPAAAEFEIVNLSFKPLGIDVVCMNPLHRAGSRLLSETSVGDSLYQWYNYCHAIHQRRSFETDGFYTVKTPIPSINPFSLYLPGPDPPWRTKTLYAGGVIPFTSGTYEPPIQQWLGEVVDTGDVFWEIGARFGYYSVGLAQLADSVVAFEGNDKWASYVHKSAEHNDLNNVDVVTGFVGDDARLDDFNSPDVALMDIDGGEYDALDTAHETIQSGTTWIIEANHTVDHHPNEIESLFRKEGYSIDRSNYPSRSDSYHILATPNR